MKPAVPAGRARTSTREAESLQAGFGRWLGTRVEADGDVRITLLGRPSGAGLSCETLLLDGSWVRSAVEVREELVLRLAPSPDAFPLFPEYDLARQAHVMRVVGARSDVPVPAVHWYEADPAVLGAPFFVMGRGHGVVAPDLPPYVFGSWITELPAHELAHVERSLVDVLAGIHGVALDEDDERFLDFPLAGPTPLRRHVANQRRYYDWIRQEGQHDFPTIEHAFAWLERRWPSNEVDRNLSWGDARLANVLFEGTRPAAVLDWEAAAIGPRELDLGWFLFFHQYYQRVAERYGHAGLPTFLEPRRVAEEYESRTGHAVRDLDWYLVYAELRQALTSIRVSSRAVHFGERPAPEDPQDLIMDRAHLEELLETT
jgi:aminoglycoside phosphotransferase (APT) family kinase protein